MEQFFTNSVLIRAGHRKNIFISKRDWIGKLVPVTGRAVRPSMECAKEKRLLRVEHS